MKIKAAGREAAGLATSSLLVLLSLMSLCWSHSVRADQRLSPVISLKGKGLPAGFTLADNPSFSAFNTNFVPSSVVYADADTGSDTNPGTFAAPVRSLSAAQILVRNSLAQSSSKNVVVVLRGTFYLPQTLNLSAADSPANGHFVVWTGDPAKPATISGGQVLNLNWSLLSASQNIYSASTGNYAFRNLIVNNQKAQRAGISLGQKALVPRSGNVIDCTQCGLPAFTAPQTIEIMRDVQWIEDRCLATLNTNAFITPVSGCLDTVRRSYVQWPTYPTYLTTIENALVVTTRAGQWSVDPNQRLLYYIPRAGENPATSTVIASQQTNLIVLQNAGNLAFVNLRFVHSDYESPSAVAIFANAQADVLTAPGVLIPAAFDCEGCHNVLVMDSEFADLGASALRMGPGSQNNLIFHNSIHDVSASGLQIGELQNVPQGTADPTETSYTYVEDNTIQHVAQDYHGSVGIFQANATHSLISHNEVHDTPYTAISIGWGQDSNQTTNDRDNLITMNLIYNADAILTDGGGVYTQSAQPGTTISLNYIHDILLGQTGLNDFLNSHDVYLDAGSSGITVANNCMGPLINSQYQQYVFLNQATGNSTDHATDCPSGTIANAGVRPQAAAGTKFVRMSDIQPIVTEWLMNADRP